MCEDDVPSLNAVSEMSQAGQEIRYLKQRLLCAALNIICAESGFELTYCGILVRLDRLQVSPCRPMIYSTAHRWAAFPEEDAKTDSVLLLPVHSSTFSKRFSQPKASFWPK